MRTYTGSSALSNESKLEELRAERAALVDELGEDDDEDEDMVDDDDDDMVDEDGHGGTAAAG